MTEPPEWKRRIRAFISEVRRLNATSAVKTVALALERIANAEQPTSTAARALGIKLKQGRPPKRGGNRSVAIGRLRATLEFLRTAPIDDELRIYFLDAFRQILHPGLIGQTTSAQAAAVALNLIAEPDREKPFEFRVSVCIAKAIQRGQSFLSAKNSAADRYRLRNADRAERIYRNKLREAWAQVALEYVDAGRGATASRRPRKRKPHVSNSQR